MAERPWKFESSRPHHFFVESEALLLLAVQIVNGVVPDDFYCADATVGSFVTWIDPSRSTDLSSRTSAVVFRSGEILAAVADSAETRTV